MLCSHAKGVQGPTGTRSNLVPLLFVHVYYTNFDHSATASGIAPLLLLPRPSFLLLLMLSVIGEEAERLRLLDGEHCCI